MPKPEGLRYWAEGPNATDHLNWAIKKMLSMPGEKKTMLLSDGTRIVLNRMDPANPRILIQVPAVPSREEVVIDERLVYIFALVGPYPTIIELFSAFPGNPEEEKLNARFYSTNLKNPISVTIDYPYDWTVEESWDANTFSFVPFDGFRQLFPVPSIPGRFLSEIHVEFRELKKLSIASPNFPPPIG